MRWRGSLPRMPTFARSWRRLDLDEAKLAVSPKPAKVEAAWSLDKPTALARHLDDINRALVVSPVKPVKSPPVAKPTRLAGLPAGISPDRAEAIVWLVGLEGLVRVAIDGWNAAHLIKSPPVPATRDRIIEAARRLILASAGKRQITAVFDSSQLGESFSAGKVQVAFVASADEELIKMAKRDATGLVVITSDRRVPRSRREGWRGRTLVGGIDRVAKDRRQAHLSIVSCRPGATTNGGRLASISGPA